MSVYTNLTLEFRDEELFFDGTEPTRYGKGHEWFTFPVAEKEEYRKECSAVGCKRHAEWSRWMIAHIDIATAQYLCANHAKALASTVKTLRPVLAVRDFNDEFVFASAVIPVDPEHYSSFPESDEYLFTQPWVTAGCPMKNLSF